MHTDTQKMIRTKDKDWAVAALVESSNGYYSPRIARRMLDCILNGESWYAERTMSCYNGDYCEEVKHSKACLTSSQ